MRCTYTRNNHYDYIKTIQVLKGLTTNSVPVVLLTDNIVEEFTAQFLVAYNIKQILLFSKITHAQSNLSKPYILSITL